ncbi:hypothetical protein LTR37_013382 [Vermiconidia calcicola]|uniref:Uncharacterized protein n=1 Tax=Vermiconidia calcicola TaxID=1690605 RepID=A0ACC3MY48_9PEZI|nr:hypothetical protein LTR37_013382 [Vermiconidia calcicola]
MSPLSEEAKAKITQSVADGFDEQIAYTQELIRIGGQRGHETDVMDWVFKQYNNRGWNPIRIEMDEGELSQHIGAGRFSETHSRVPIIIGTHKPKGEAKGKSLILNGHLDVVPLGPADMWKADPYSGLIEGDRLYGRGAGDMRSGAAANVWALDALRRIGLQPASEIILQAVVEEESTGNGTLMAHLKGYKADAALIPEPMQEQLVRANVGVLWFQVEVRGRPVHVREMSTGTNAIDASMKVIGALREMEEEWDQRYSSQQYFQDEKHPLNLNVAIVKAGDWASSVPAWCQVDCRIAIVPGVSAQSAADEIEKKVADFAANDPYLSQNPPKIRWNGFFSEGYVLEPGSEAENVLRRAHQQAAGEELTTQTSTAYIDARVHSLYDKIPAMVYGPIAGDIHGFDEWVSIESVKRVTTAMALFIAEWCGVEEM